jgi:hypothetical protein
LADNISFGCGGDSSSKRWRKTKLMAYFLWENAGRPVSDGMEFWLRAEAMIDDNAQCVFMN